MLVLILNARRYSFQPEGSSRLLEGVKCRVATIAAQERDFIGVNSSKMNGPIKLFPKFEAVPGLYEVECSFSENKEGKTEATLLDAKLIAALELFPTPAAAGK